MLNLCLKHAALMDAAECLVIQTSVHEMLRLLHEAVNNSLDPPDAPHLTTSYLVHTGRPGRPSVYIPRDVLAAALQYRGPTHLAPIFSCSSRTVRRIALEYGLVEPGPPVYVDYIDEAEEVHRFYTSSTGASSDLSDDELDALISDIVERFPNFGRRMIDGHLKHLGHSVPRSRVQAAYLRVHGPPAASFGRTRIQRRVYSVPGPNSLWHHDGQHGVLSHIIFFLMEISDSFIGLIRWKIVMHAFIDGFSRLVTGIRASNNNRAQMVLDLFTDIVAVFGMPSRGRGDHGIENLLVAACMEAARGVERGSYIWGRCIIVLIQYLAFTCTHHYNRSVHNIRIERLWCDVTQGFGAKWKRFFQDLEAHDGLIVDRDAHIWLLHHLFLPAINSDAEEWADAWNNHTLSFRGERQRSPADMYFFGMIQNGPRGLHMADEELDDIQGYGIDWEDYDDDRIFNHHNHANIPDNQGDNPFSTTTHRPSAETLTRVDVVPPGCPLTADQIVFLDSQLELLPYFDDQGMDMRRLLWISALNICDYLLS